MSDEPKGDPHWWGDVFVPPADPAPPAAAGGARQIDVFGPAPHMCRDDHDPIRHWDDGDDEMCPLCRALAVAAHHRAEGERWQAAVIAWQEAAVNALERLQRAEAALREADKLAAYCMDLSRGTPSWWEELSTRVYALRALSGPGGDTK